MQTTPDVLSWISNHIHVLGWSGVLTVCGFLIKAIVGGSNLKTRVLTVEENINHAAVNCWPSTQKAAEASNVKLDTQTELLRNIDKNIAILVDRK